MKQSYKMLDTISIQKSIAPPQFFLDRVKEPFEYNNILFNPHYDKFGGVQKYVSSMDNLKIYLSDFGANHYFTITNSIHKFWIGNNYSDFNYTDLKNSIECMEDTLDISLSDAFVKKLSYGVNIEAEPDNIFPLWMTFKNKEFYTMQMKGKKYGAYCPLSNYKIKGYNKSLEVWTNNREKINDNLFRFEVEVSNMNHLNKRKEAINIYHVKDLFDKDKLYFLGKDMLTKYEAIEKDVLFDFSNLERKEAIGFAIISSGRAINEHIKKNYNDSYKTYRTNYKKALGKAKADFYQDEVKDLITNKWENLLRA